MAEKQIRAKKVGALGRLLARLPSGCPLLYPLYQAARLDTVKEVFFSPELPQAFDGIKIAFVTDIHYGALLGEDRVRALAQRVNGWEADVVLLGGDYGEDARGAVEFWNLHPGFRAGTLVAAAMGNHDRTEPEDGAEAICAAMEADGVTPVVNGAVRVEKDGAVMAFASTDDFYNGQPDLEKTAAACRGADYTVFFPHNPDILPETYKLPGQLFYQLALCGHTHGGQVTVFRRAVISPSNYGSRYLSGWYRENGVDILVSNGVGTSALPVRWGARPQVHLITLKKE